jgi:Myosin head (motor domain)
LLNVPSHAGEKAAAPAKKGAGGKAKVAKMRRPCESTTLVDTANTSIMFNEQGEPVGAQITNYLLEKGRVAGQIENERNFLVDYQFKKCALDEQRGQCRAF